MLHSFGIAVAIATFFPAMDDTTQSLTPPLTKEALKDWTFSDASVWTIESTPEHGPTLFLVKRPPYQPPVRSPHAIALLPQEKIGDCQFDVKVKSTTRDYGHRDLCLFLGYQDASHFYYVHLAKAADAHAHSIFLVNGKDRVSIATKRTKGVNWTNDWHQVRVNRSGSNIRVYFDDMASPVMETNDSTLGAGRIGVGSFDDTGKFADIRVTIKNSGPVPSAPATK